jgi:flavin-dependent dehydrogenase
MHLPDPGLQADLELHFSDHAYVGLCRVDGDTVNACGLVRRMPGDPPPADRRNPGDLMWGQFGGSLQRRLSPSTPVSGSVVTVAGLDFGRPAPESRAAIRVGDCQTMTPPFTGNGMSMAIESGRAAAPALEAYSSGACTWEEARRTVSRTNGQLTDARLRWSRALHRALWHPTGRRVLLHLGASSPGLWKALFAATR